MLLNCGVGEDLRVSWTARRPSQSILKEIRPEYSLEGLMLKLKLLIKYIVEKYFLPFHRLPFNSVNWFPCCERNFLV